MPLITPGALALTVPPHPPATPAPGARAPSTPGAGHAPQAFVSNDAVVHRNADGRDDVRVEVLRLPRGDGRPLHTQTAFTLPLMRRGKGETRPMARATSAA